MKAKNKKGFLLLEVIVAVVVITAGTLYVIRTYSASKDALQRSTGLLKMGLLLEKKMWELEAGGGVEEGSYKGEFEGDEYSWSINATPLEGSRINQIVISAFHRKDPENTKIFLATYLKSPQR